MSTPRRSEETLAEWLLERGQSLPAVVDRLAKVLARAVSAFDLQWGNEIDRLKWHKGSNTREFQLEYRILLMLTGAVTTGKDLHDFWRLYTAARGLHYGPQVRRCPPEHPWQRLWRELPPLARHRYDLQVAIVRALAPEGLLTP